MSRKLKIIVGAAGGGVLAVVGSIVFLASWMNGSATGTVHVGTPAASSTAAQKPAATLPVDTRYFATTLPAGYVLRRTSDTPNDQVYLFGVVADTTSTADQQFAATIAKTPAGGISETGDYHLRASQTDTYQPFHSTYLPAGTTAFHSVSGPASITIFWPRGDTYCEITLSTEGGATEAQLSISAQAAIAQWQWK